MPLFSNAKPSAQKASSSNLLVLNFEMYREGNSLTIPPGGPFAIYKPMGIPEIQALVKYLELHKEITALDISTNGVTDEGATLLATAETALDTIDISSNKLTPKSIEKFLENKKIKKLTALFMDDNGIEQEKINQQIERNRSATVVSAPPVVPPPAPVAMAMAEITDAKQTKQSELKTQKEIKKSDGMQQQIAIDVVSKELWLLVEKKIMDLKKQRDQSYYFRAATRRQAIEKKLDALEHLKEIMKNTRELDFGFMDKMEDKKHILFREEQEFVNKFTQIENRAYVRNRLAVQNSNNYQKKIMADNKIISSAVCHQAIEILTKRKEELESSYRTTIRSKKIALLTHLISKLKQGISFAAVIKEMREKNPDTYLLFEGNTGKKMKLVEYSQLTKQDILNRIDIQISALKAKRNKIYFFNTKEKNAITQETIKALMSLRTSVESLRESDSSLSIYNGEHLQTLYKYQQPLMEDLNLWVQASTILAADVKALGIFKDEPSAANSSSQLRK